MVDDVFEMSVCRWLRQAYRHAGEDYFWWKVQWELQYLEEESA